MDNKTMTIVGVVIVAVIAIAGVAFFMMNNNSSEKDYNASEIANNFINNYDGKFGKFTIADGSTDNQAIIGYNADQHNYKGEDLGAKRAMNVKIVHCESKDAAAGEFVKYLTIKDPPYSTKNGSKGETLLSQVNKLGMADKHPTVLLGTDSVKVTGTGAEIKNVKAKDYGCDQIYILYASYHKTDDATKQQYSQFSLVMQDGKNLIIINQSSKDEFSMYYNTAIMDSSEVPAGGVYISVDDFEKELKNFCKAF